MFYLKYLFSLQLISESDELDFPKISGKEDSGEGINRLPMFFSADLFLSLFRISMLLRRVNIWLVRLDLFLGLSYMTLCNFSLLLQFIYKNGRTVKDGKNTAEIQKSTKSTKGNNHLSSFFNRKMWFFYCFVSLLKMLGS